MSKHLKPSKWLELFKLYQIDINLCWKKLSQIKKVTPSTKYWFIQKYNKFLKHNEDLKILVSMTGKAPKKGKGSGRSSKNNKVIQII